VPVGATDPEAGVTVVLRAMLVPLTPELGVADSVVVVTMRGTVIVRLEALDVDEASFVSPL
jgi:hypothetical protein